METLLEGIIYIEILNDHRNQYFRTSRSEPSGSRWSLWLARSIITLVHRPDEFDETDACQRVDHNQKKDKETSMLLAEVFHPSEPSISDIPVRLRPVSHCSQWRMVPPKSQSRENGPPSCTRVRDCADREDSVIEPEELPWRQGLCVKKAERGPWYSIEEGIRYPDGNSDTIHKCPP